MSSPVDEKVTELAYLQIANERIADLEKHLETVKGNAKRWEQLAITYKRELEKHNTK